MDILYAKQAVLLKEAKHVMKKLISEDPMESLCMVDLIQRLGIEHHFQEHIEAALEKQHFIVITDPIDFVQSHQLDEVALSFRLLRQGGYSVNADIFERLKKNKVQFREAYGEDVKSLIAVHEAAQLSIGEEDTSLEDVGRLCRELLHSWLSRHHHHHHEAQFVAISLQQPLHHNLPRFVDKTILLRNFKPDKESVCFVELAEINSCIVRLMNQHEALQVSKWWKGEAMSKEPKFAEYEALKWYMWSMACFTDPSFSDQRLGLTKTISLVYIIDDIFDVYGTLDQLILFTDAVKRWELTGTEHLPQFMKNCLSALYEITNAFAEKIYKKHGLNPIDTLKKSWVQLLNASLEGAHWSDSGELPKSGEYLNHATVSTGVHVVLVHSFFLFHQNITKETLAILDDFPDIIYSVAKILRLCDDLEGHKNKNQSGFDGSYIECYMREHQETSAEDAERHVEELISMEWKRLNRQVLGRDQQFPSSFTKFCLSAARMVPLMYHYRTNPSLSNLHQHVKSIANAGVAHM
ncbi:neryl diphosphate diphosphatase, chloroplastic [Arachis duranensis]|uniref:Neryl diphosphate diphosphatase, chloroplastic n=1 Tax=Arachis duranensis TaxID=130453 RepID=A0A6P4BNZ5_ARADU|nr:neryl diphosphate diphosphatase, chloroplastic [Arachis duranensis]